MVATKPEFLPDIEYHPFETRPGSPAVPQPVQDVSGLLGSNKKDNPLYKHWAGTMPTQGNILVLQTDSGLPDYWIIYLLPTWSATQGQYQPSILAITQGGGPARDAEVYLTGGGVARLPGVSDYLTLESRVIGTNPVYYGVLAVRKSDIDVLVQPGSG